MLLPLQTERLTLRRFEDRDTPAILRLSADPTVHAVADELGANEREVLAYIGGQRALDEFELQALFDIAIATTDGDEVIGMATLVRAEHHAEVGFALHSDVRGRGHATEAASALVSLAFTAFGIAEVRAQVAPANATSRAVLERVGLADTGGRFDVREDGDLAYAIARDEWERRSG